MKVQWQVRFYTTTANYAALKSVHELDAALRHAFETGAHDKGIAFVQLEGSRVIPCAPAKVLASELKALRPGSRWVPVGFESGPKSKIQHDIAELDILIKSLGCEEGPRLVDLDIAVEIIKKVQKTLFFDKNKIDFEWKNFIAALNFYSKIVAPNSIAGRVVVLAAKDRSIRRLREGGRYSDAPDTKQQREALAEQSEHLPALILLRQTGAVEQGWGGYPFWWPVLLAPVKGRTSVFATVDAD